MMQRIRKQPGNRQKAGRSQPLADRTHLGQSRSSQGNHAVLGGVSSVIQPKLKIGSPNDKYEREADQVARAIVSGSNHIDLQSIGGTDGTPVVHRLPAAPTATAGPPGEALPESVGEVLKSGRGRALETSTREFMESRFGGYDFSDVRVHTNAQAAKSAETLNAQAYTAGRHIVFNRGMYSPQTTKGRNLLAHELTHTVQQGQGEIFDNKNVYVQRDAQDKGFWGGAGEYLTGIKKKAYSGLIKGLRGAQSWGLKKLRNEINKMPPSYRAVAEKIVYWAVEVPSDILISFVLAVVSLVVGFVGGIIKLVIGLVTFLIGLVKFLILYVLQLFSEDYREQYVEMAEQILNIFKNLGPALRKLLSDWIEEWKKADTDHQSIMIGELTGEILALIASFLIAGGIASKLPKTSPIPIRFPIPVPAVAAVGPRGAALGGEIVLTIPSVAVGPPIAAASILGAEATSLSERIGKVGETETIKGPPKKRGKKITDPEGKRVSTKGKRQTAEISIGKGGILRRRKIPIKVPSKAQLKKLRSRFNTSRKNWIKKMADDPRVKAFFGEDSAQIKLMKSDGRAPAFYEVHHNYPLNAGGQNVESNFALIPKRVHSRVTAEFNDAVARGLTEMEFPVFDDFVGGIGERFGELRLGEVAEALSRVK